MTQAKAALSDYDIRQIKLMKDLTIRLLDRKVPLNKFVNDQWALLDLLETVDEAWRASFLERVNAIEIILATALDGDSLRLSSSEEKEIDSIAETIIKSLDELLPI